jgi:hypothetical protein
MNHIPNTVEVSRDLTGSTSVYQWYRRAKAAEHIAGGCTAPVTMYFCHFNKKGV